MAYQNFIPNMWAETIERSLERDCVFAEDCNRNYEGIVKNKGESVTILGVGRPTITTISKAERNTALPAAEEVEDTSVIMYIDQLSRFNYKVGDIDKAQAVGGLMDVLEKETSEGLANAVDVHIASMAVEDGVPQLYTNATRVVTGTASSGQKNVLDVLDEAIQRLYENDVKPTTEIVVTVSPRFFTLFKREYIKADTNNSDMLKNGRVARYGNVTVKMSNNVCTTSSGTVDNMMMRTKRAIAFAQPMTHVEAYRPENGFADAVKGFILYQAKVVRPAEVVNINVKYA